MTWSLEECVDLRVKDLDFDRQQIIVRQGKGRNDRVTMLPSAAREALTKHLEDVRRIHERDLAKGFGRVALPFALDRKFPNARPSGVGSSCFRWGASVAIHDSDRRPDSICTSRWSRRRWRRRRGAPASRSVSVRT